MRSHGSPGASHPESRNPQLGLISHNVTFENEIALHAAGISGLHFSPNGQMIATASDDQTVKIWNRDGMLINTLFGHNNSVNSLKFSRDNKKLATGSTDKTVLLWNVDNLSLDKFMDRGCSWLSDYLKTNPNAPTDICEEIKR